MKYNKNEGKAKDTKLHKRAKSNVYFNKSNSQDKFHEKILESELIHLSLIIDESNKISFDFKQNEDVTEICEKIAQKLKLRENIKIKLQANIKKQIEAFGNKNIIRQNPKIANNVIERLYNESVEKRKILKLENEKNIKLKEEEELKKFTFSPKTSGYNRINENRYYAKIEDEINNKNFKKYKKEVYRVIKGINNYVECKQFIYEKNILRKNKNPENRINSNENKKKKFRSDKTCKSHEHYENINITSKPSRDLKKNRDIKEASNSESLESSLQEQNFKPGPSKVKTILEMNSKENGDSGSPKVFRRDDAKADFVNLNKKMTSKRIIDDINTKNTQNDLTSQNVSRKYNTTTSLNNNLTSFTLKNTRENNLIIPEEQSTSAINPKKSNYVNLYRRINLSNSSLTNNTRNTSTISKQHLSNKNLLDGFNKQTSQVNPSEDENKKFEEANFMDCKLNDYKNIPKSSRTGLHNINISNNKFEIGHNCDILKNIYDEKLNLNQNNEETFIRKNSKLKEENKAKEIKYAAPRYFSFKDFDDFGGFSINKATKEEILIFEKRENRDINTKSDSLTKSPEVKTKHKPSLKSFLENTNKNKTLLSNKSSTQNNENPVKLFTINSKNLSEKKNSQKSECIFNRLYKSHHDIKLKKEKHIENVFRNIYSFKPNVNKNRPQSTNQTSKCFFAKNDNEKNQNIFDRLYNSSRIQKTKSFFSLNSFTSDFKMGKTQIQTEKSKNMTCTKSRSLSSFRNKENKFLSLREQNRENELYKTFLNDCKVKEILKTDIHKNFSENLNKFKINNLKEIFEIICKNFRDTEDFQTMEKFGISTKIKDNLILPLCHIINERNLDFNFNNFYLIANELLNDFIN